MRDVDKLFRGFPPDVDLARRPLFTSGPTMKLGSRARPRPASAASRITSPLLTLSAAGGRTKIAVSESRKRQSATFRLV